jgi:hypothetical protein
MLTGDVGASSGFQGLFDQVDPTAWSIQLVAQNLIGRAGCRTKSTVDTFAQDFAGFDAFGRAFKA